MSVSCGPRIDWSHSALTVTCPVRWHTLIWFCGPWQHSRYKIQPAINLFIHPSINSLIVHPSIHPFIHPSIYCCTQSTIHTYIHTYIHLLSCHPSNLTPILPSTHPLPTPLTFYPILPIIHLPFIHPSIHPSFYPFYNSSIRPSIHRLPILPFTQPSNFIHRLILSINLL